MAVLFSFLFFNYVVCGLLLCKKAPVPEAKLFESQKSAETANIYSLFVNSYFSLIRLIFFETQRID